MNTIETGCLLLALLAGCDRAAASADDAELVPGVVGDWFMCANASCSELVSTGLRLAADHRMHHLQAAAPSGQSASHFADGGRFVDGECVTP